MYAAQSPCAIWRKQTLRVQSIACTNAAPFYRGGRRQTRPVTNPALAASPTLLRIKASETESYKPQTRHNIMTRRVNLSRQTCRNPSAKAGTHNHRASLSKLNAGPACLSNEGLWLWVPDRARWRLLVPDGVN